MPEQHLVLAASVLRVLVHVESVQNLHLVLAMCGAVCVLEILVHHFELGRGTCQRGEGAVERVVVAVHKVFSGGALLLNQRHGCLDVVQRLRIQIQKKISKVRQLYEKKRT